MQTKIINPYTEFGTKHKNSLDYIITNLPLNLPTGQAGPTFENLNEQLVNSFYIPDPLNPSPVDLLVPFLKTVLPHTYNGYVNAGASGEWRVASSNLPAGQAGTKYNAVQQKLIAQMLEGIRFVPAQSIAEYLSNLEEAAVTAGLNYDEQTPLLLALAIGKASNEYWQAQVAVAAAWVNYLNADSAINYQLLTGWVTASMQAALLTYGLVKPPQIQFADIYISTIASVGLGAGKVIFGWLGKNP